MIIRKPRPKRYPKPKIEEGSVFEFLGGFPYNFVSHLNVVRAAYTLKYIDGGVKIIISSEPKSPEAKPKRRPKGQDHGLEFNIVDDINAKHKEKNPELFNRLKALQEKFVRLGRKTYIYCPLEPARHCKSLATCFARCSHKCGELAIDNLMAKDDDKADFFRDLLIFQRLVNLIYGTVREQDHFDDED